MFNRGEIKAMTWAFDSMDPFWGDDDLLPPSSRPMAAGVIPLTKAVNTGRLTIQTRRRSSERLMAAAFRRPPPPPPSQTRAVTTSTVKKAINRFPFNSVSTVKPSTLTDEELTDLLMSPMPTVTTLGTDAELESMLFSDPPLPTIPRPTHHHHAPNIPSKLNRRLSDYEAFLESIFGAGPEQSMGEEEDAPYDPAEEQEEEDDEEDNDDDGGHEGEAEDKHLTEVSVDGQTGEIQVPQRELLSLLNNGEDDDDMIKHPSALRPGDERRQWMEAKARKRREQEEAKRLLALRPPEPRGLDEGQVARLRLQLSVHLQLLIQSLGLANELKGAGEYSLVAIKLLLVLRDRMRAIPALHFAALERLDRLMTSLPPALLRVPADDPILRPKTTVKTFVCTGGLVHPLPPNLPGYANPLAFAKGYGSLMALFSGMLDPNLAIQTTLAQVQAPNAIMDMQQHNFTPFEDQLILCGLHRFGMGNWEALQSHFLPHRTAKQCHIRYKNLSSRRSAPNPIKTFNAELRKPLNRVEEDLIYRGVMTFGMDFRTISNLYLPHRAPTILRYLWQQLSESRRIKEEDDNKEG